MAEERTSKPDFFFSCSEHVAIDEPRACWAIRQVEAYECACLLARIEPTIIGQTFGLGGDDIDYVILGTVHEGCSLFPINKRHMHVHVLGVLPTVDISKDQFGSDEYIVVTRSILYRSMEEARKHV